MKRILLLTSLLFITLSAKASLLDELLSLNAKCELLNSHFCILPKGSFNYPNETIILFNDDSKLTDLMIHLHGYSFGPLSTGEDFDSTPLNMVKSFAFDSAISFHKNIVMVIPFTRGKCNDYDQYLSIGDKFENYIKSITEKINPTASIHLSAHSGGGRTIAKTINRMKTIIQSATLFDANYNESLTYQYSQWVNLKNKILNLITVAPQKTTIDFQTFVGNTPFNEAKKIFNLFDGPYVKKEMVPPINPRFYFHKKSLDDTQINFWYEANSGKYHHWYIVRDSFPTVLKEILNH